MTQRLTTTASARTTINVSHSERWLKERCMICVFVYPIQQV